MTFKATAILNSSALILFNSGSPTDAFYVFLRVQSASLVIIIKYTFIKYILCARLLTILLYNLL